ncbi:RagB/SusD family nutrient uptake outer membrane protein [Odoribacter sp. AF15-53]|uniref:RagB/SusD family nutrient uptake outer membrane protein n=1 Tax=Odoribacter sp. AF15-53 TaxID=2292236 RepID=UPI000E4BB679|nr:RagB/SusD family nutrient uptake outer membrane protein [Odoribacter sp. AF15-53]RHR82566.1 RagB/SusD family nutrient uptake outer membrane protein [Odoribacter sp. AF15-53]
MKKYIFLYLLVWLTTSCSDFLEEYSNDLAKVESYSDLDELLIGDGYWYPSTAYTSSSMLRIDGDTYLMPLHLMSDETEIYRKYENDKLRIQDNFFGWITWQRQVGSSYKTGQIGSEDKDWNELYKRINIVNQIIGEIDKQSASNRQDELEKVRIKGESAFLRAIYYFTLANMYAQPYSPNTAQNTAGIPVKRTQQIEDKEYTSAPLSEVYNIILEDLETARTCLQQTSVKNHPYRADIVAAHLLSSRVYLYMQDWQNAYNHADSVLRRKEQLTDLNSREGDDSNILNRSSVETIFSMGGHLLSSALYGTNGTSWGTLYNTPTYIIPDNLVELYGPTDNDNDLRRGIYIKQIEPEFGYGKASPVWVFAKVNGPQQYTNGRTACDVGDVFLMRTAEAYLNGAEAAAQLGNEGEAVRLLRLLRSHRVKNENATYDNGGELIRFIREERERELCLEGHRWFDLRRYMVDTRYPFTKRITHYYTDFKPNGSFSYQQQTMRYVLEENDPAYTLALPIEVTNFQNTLPSVKRPDRPGSIYDEYADLASIGEADGKKTGLEVGLEDMEAGNKYNDTRNNNNYYRYYKADYSQQNAYRNAYQQAFKEAYAQAYSVVKSAAYLKGEEDAQKAIDYEDESGSWDGYDKFFNDNQFETEQEKNDYLKGFEDVYYGY